MAKKKDVYKVQPLTPEKDALISTMIEMYDIKTTEDIQAALKDLLGGTIKSMMEAEMDEHLGYGNYERTSGCLLHNKNTKSCKAKMEKVASPFWRMLQLHQNSLCWSALVRL